MCKLVYCVWEFQTNIFFHGVYDFKLGSKGLTINKLFD